MKFHSINGVKFNQLKQRVVRFTDTVTLILIFFAIGYLAGPAYAQVKSDSLNGIIEIKDSTQFGFDSVGYFDLVEKDFNDGLVLTVPDLIQGKVPGLGLYRRGSNPNGSYTFRMRGTSALEANSPLYVVDGMTVTDPSVIDPYDIQSIRIAKGIAAIALYGFQGSTGVIEITTKSGLDNSDITDSDRFMVEYNGYFALSSKSKVVPVMDREEYLEAGGADLGGDTDWQEAVSRTAVSQVNMLSISGGDASTRYRLSGSVRDVEGILLKSGFDQINTRANISHSVWDDKLTLKLNLATNKRNSNYSFTEGFRYANIFNPTSPVRFETGAFVQPILFDNFNPLAILELNTNDGQTKNLSYNVQTDFEVSKRFELSANLGQQFNSDSYGEFYPYNSFFRGLNRDGLARRSFRDDKFTFFEARGEYEKTFGENLVLNGIAGYGFKEYFSESLTLELGNLPTNDLSYYAIDLSGDRVLGNPANVFVNSYATPEERIIAIFGRAGLSYGERIFLQTSLRREGSTKLGKNNRWALFPAVSLALNVNSYWKSDMVSELTAHIAYGKTGRLPDQSGLSKDLYEYSFLDGGTVEKIQKANPDLKWEDRKEINFGIDYGLLNNRLQGILEFYRIITGDLIQPIYIPQLFYPQYQNVGEIETRGAELTVQYDFLQKKEIKWSTRLILSTYKSILNDYPREEILAGSPGAPGQGSAGLVRIAVGEELGQILGPVFSGQVDEGGFPIMTDINKDGELRTDFGSALDEDADFAKLGSAIPDFELGWSHTVGYRNWSMQASFQGAFGHSLVNLNRMFYEPRDLGSISSYNRLNTDKAVEDLSVSIFSSLYVEPADYLKLECVTASYRVPMNMNKMITDITAYMTIENAFTITNYTGLSPEPVLEDLGPVSNGGRIQGDPASLIMGIDRRMDYLPARTIVFGAKFIF